jgi:hypothetical protein
MAQEFVNLGGQPNDGTGDSIRDAFDKVNKNFNEVYADVAVIQDFIGSNTNITAAVGQIQGFSGIIANFSATQVLFQQDLNTVSGNILTNNSNYVTKILHDSTWTNVIFTINASTASVTANLTALTNSVSSLTSTVTALAGDSTVTVAQLSASTATLASSLTTLSNTVSALDQRVNTNYNSTTNLISASTSSAIRYAVPIGIVSLWYGTIGNIPSGWALCDGQNGTPDLRNKFVIGAGDTYSVNATGGSANANVVAHSHQATTTINDPGHTHENGIYTQLLRPPYEGSLTGNDTINSGIELPVGSPDAGRMLSTSTGIQVSVSVASTGTSGANANLPPYYALCYIMKVA